jgi:hypothetical protein
MTATNAIKPVVISSEKQLFNAIREVLRDDGQVARRWRNVIAPGMVRVYRTLDAATEARDRMIENAILPELAPQYKCAMETTLPDTRSKVGQAIYDQNVKSWKVNMVPEWLALTIETMPKEGKVSATKQVKTYKGYVELVQAFKASARAQCKVQFKRICEYAWPTVKAEKPKAEKPKAEGDVKPEDSKLNPRQTLVQLLNNAKAYAQKHEDLPSQVAAIAAISKAIELLGS